MNTDPEFQEISKIFFWLVPSAADRRLLEKLINRLADEYDAPRFMPHVTALVARLTQDESPQQILESATKGMVPLKLDLLRVDHSPDRFKSIFIQLHSDPLAPLNAALRASCRWPGSYRLDAHLSLLYNHLPVLERQALASSLQLPHSPVRFDSVIAVQPGPNRKSLDEVKRWRTVAQVGLGT